ncbi:MAG: GTPase-associated system all-helical protein GASH [Terriglobales bacterium]
MIDIARHVRIFDKEPSDDLVNKRTIIIGSMAEKFLKFKTYDDYFGLVEDIAVALESKDFHLPDKRTKEVEEAIRTQSSAFDHAGQNLQVLTCLMLATLKAINGGQPSVTAWSRPEIIAATTWLALGIQKPRSEAKLESLRTELIENSREIINRSAEISRARTPVPDPNVKITEFSELKVAEAVNKGLLKCIDVLRQNAALDREETDLLWWSLGDWSTLQHKHFRELPMPVAAVSAGLEAAGLLRRLPTEGHKQLALRHILDGSGLKVTDFVESLGKDAEPIRAAYPDNEHVRKFPHVFALLAAIAGQKVKSQLLDARSWGARAMLEAVVLRLSQNNETVL